MKLVTIGFSHYCERARWALDRFDVHYTESAWMPMFHFVGVAWATRGRAGKSDRVSTRWSTPVLVTDDGEVISDSGTILRWVSDHHGTPDDTLYPPEHDQAITAMEGDLHDRLGPHARRWGYQQVLHDAPLVDLLAQQNVGGMQAAVFSALRPVASVAIRKALAIDPQRAEASLQHVRDVFDEYAPLVRDRPYLFGDHFTAADLTLSALAVPALLVSRAEGFHGRMPLLSEVSGETAAIVRDLRDSEVGRFVLRMFARERRRRLSAEGAFDFGLEADSGHLRAAPPPETETSDPSR